MVEPWLTEQLRTVRNLVDISYLILKQGEEAEYLLPTALELLYVEAQHITLDHCVAENKEAKIDHT